MEGKLAGLVSNPPYIPSKDISSLQAEVGRHEPRVALDGGIDGMDSLLHLCDGAALFLKPRGFFAFEVCIFCFVEKYVLNFIYCAFAYS
jgi:release factor glutamine methyltransferase